MNKQQNACRNSGIGGQAVLEGIMMRNKEKYAIAVRRPDGEIEVKVDTYHGLLDGSFLKKTPFVRGVFQFLESLIVGMRCLLFSASFLEEEDEKKESEEQAPADRKKAEDLLIAGTVGFAFLLAIGLFLVLPYGLSRFLGRNMDSVFLRSVIEGLVRVAVFLAYMLAISRMKDIQRTFAYHGAEHKCINCIENGKTLTVEHVLGSSRLHRRCGTSFLFFVILISIVFHMFIFTENRLLQVVIRLLLIPVIAGVSYEFIRLAGSSSSPVVAALSRPGLALQRLTTREPDASQAEVAIRAVEAVFDWKSYLEEQGTEQADAYG